MMVKTLFINLNERSLLREKTAIPRDLFAGERELINLAINNDSNNHIRKDTTSEEFINSLIVFLFWPGNIGNKSIRRKLKDEAVGFHFR